MNTIHTRQWESSDSPSRPVYWRRPCGVNRAGRSLLVLVAIVAMTPVVLGCGAHKPAAADKQSDHPANTPAPAQGSALPEGMTAKDMIVYPNEDYNASIVQILAHRDRYHGKKVQIEGYLHVRFEGTAIYLSKEDADYLMTRNGLWVSFDKRAVPYEGIVGPTQFDRKYVLIEGTFDKNDMGHKSSWQGAIENVTRIYELTKRN